MQNLSSLLARTCGERPHTIALRCGDTSISFGDLDILIRRYQTFIRELIGAEAKSPNVAALITHKSIEAVAFGQAALRCGMAYTVLDPRQPSARLQLMLQDCKPAVVFCDRSAGFLQRVFSGQPLPPTVLIEGAPAAPPWLRSVQEAADREPAADIAPVTASDAALIVYTSGSTGIPKGVKISHANALYAVHWAQSAFSFQPDEVFLNQAHLGSDFCILDYYNAWNVGACIVMVPEHESIFPVRVVELIRTERVTNLWLVPSNIISLVRQGTLLAEPPSTIRRLLYAGEPFPVKPLREVFRWMGEKNVYNLYGPSETNVATYHEVRECDLERDVPIGEALAGTELCVRREDGSLASTGDGELCVSSPSVFLGYTNRPDLERERLFRHDDKLWYRTGDLARIDESGTAWFRGRCDQMVKIRGFRVELQEVELALLEHPSLVEAVVHAHTDPVGGEKELHAFCVATHDGATSESIRLFAGKRLPAYMIPRRIHILDRIPQNDRNKVDRLALARMVSRGHDAH